MIFAAAPCALGHSVEHANTDSANAQPEDRKFFRASMPNLRNRADSKEQSAVDRGWPRGARKRRHDSLLTLADITGCGRRHRGGLLDSVGHARQSALVPDMQESAVPLTQLRGEAPFDSAVRRDPPPLIWYP